MSVKPDFANMPVLELRAYVLRHRDDKEALHAYLDKLHSESPNVKVYRPEDDVAEAIADYMKHKIPGDN